MGRPIDTSNIQGGVWPRLPKNYESYLFYKITDADRFRENLGEFIENITTGAECEERLTKIQMAKEGGRKKLIPFAGVNISFSHKGLQKVR